MENQRNGFVRSIESIPLDQLNHAYDSSDDDSDGYINPSKFNLYDSEWQENKVASENELQCKPIKQVAISPSPYATMDLIRELPSRNLESLTSDLQEVTVGDSSHEGTLSRTATMGRKQNVDSKYLTIKLASLHSPDMDADKFYQIITSDPNMTPEDIKNTLRNAHQSLTLKRTVKRKLTSAGSKQRKPLQISFWKRWKYSAAMVFQKWQYTIQDILSNLDLWYSHMKIIRGNFGSGVTSYFLFLRWLFFLNLFISIPLLGFISVPQIIYTNSNDSIASSHLLTVIYNDTEFQAKDILTGSGYFSDTLMYYGHYTNNSIEVLNGNTYSLPLAYLTTCGTCFLLYIIIMAVSTLKSYKKNYIQTSIGLKNVFAAKIFSAWDYSIETPHAASLKSRSIYNELKELLYLDRKKIHTSSLQTVILRFVRRLVINVIIFAMIACSGYLIYYLLEEKLLNNKIPVIEDMKLALVVGCMGFVLPPLFLVFSEWEWFASKQVQLYLNLVRVTLLKVVILGVLIYFWLVVIPIQNDKEGIFSDKDNITSTSAPNSPKQLVCWENQLGQEIYRLLIVHTILILLSALLGEFLRSVIYSYCCQWIGAPEFDIAYNTLDLIYTQTLVCVGTFYCPFLPIIATIKLLIVFYVKRFSVMHCQPSLKPWKAVHAQTVFLSLTFINGILSILSVGYVIINIMPSPYCGPFKTKPVTYDVVLDVLSLDKAFNSGFRYLFSPFLIFLYLLALCITLYIVRAVACAHAEMIRLLREQLILEGKDKVFLLNLFESAMHHKIFQANGHKSSQKGKGQFVGDKEHSGSPLQNSSDEVFPSVARRRLDESGDGSSRRGSGTSGGTLERLPRPSHQQGFQYLSKVESPRTSMEKF